MGYHRAGFTEIVGVDIKPQRRYPFTFIQGDATNPPVDLTKFDAIHASPPCQVHSVLAHLAASGHRDLIPQTRKLLQQSGLPYVIENVPGAPLRQPVMLCGTMFNLRTGDAELRRHRIFETNFSIPAQTCNHGIRTIGIFGSKGRDTAAEKRHYQQSKETRGAPPADILFPLRAAQAAMGIDYMNYRELSQAIPPAYTEWIGRQLLGN